MYKYSLEDLKRYAYKEGQEFVWVYRERGKKILASDPKTFFEAPKIESFSNSNHEYDACIVTKDMLERRDRWSQMGKQIHIAFVEDVTLKVVQKPIEEEPTAEEYISQFTEFNKETTIEPRIEVKMDFNESATV